MKLLLIFSLIPISIFGQESKSPRIIILSAEEFSLDSSLIEESKKYEYTLSDELVQDCISRLNEYEDEDRDYIKKMNQAECEFSRNMNISSAFTLSLNSWLTVKLYGIFDDAIIYPLKRGTEDGYKSLADQHNINWIVNIKKINLLTNSTDIRGTALIELWNRNSNEVTLRKEIEIDDKNHGGEMSCDEGTIECIMINGSVYITADLLESMFSKKKYWR